MKISAFEGSPRVNGNTEKLVKAILEGARESGAETEFFKLSEMNISTCLGCFSCRETGRCVTEDDMRMLLEKIQTSDALVLGSPVYMWQVSAPTKLFMDRLVPFIRPDFSTRLQGKKKLIFAYTQGNPDVQSFKTYFDYMERLFSFLHYDVKGTIVAAGTRDENDILQQSELLEKAGEVGKNLLA